MAATRTPKSGKDPYQKKMCAVRLSEREKALVDYAVKAGGHTFREPFMRSAVLEKTASILGCTIPELETFKLPE